MSGSFLHRHKWHQVAILVRDRSPGWFVERVAAQAIERLSRSSCLTRMVCIGNTRFRGEAFLGWLKSQGVDAALDTNAGWLGNQRRPIRHGGFPLVTLGPMHPKLNVSSVNVDAVAASRLQIGHLESVGFRSCGYMITSDSPAVRIRFESFVNQAKEIGLWEPGCLVDLRPQFAAHPAFTVELKSERELKQAIRAARKPLAFCSHNDFAAAALLDWVLQRGYDVPGEIGVVGCDDDPMYSLASPGLTTVRMPVDKLGDAAAEILLQALRHRKSPPEHRLLAPSLVVRGSTVASTGSGRWLHEVTEIIRVHMVAKHFGDQLAACTGWSYETVARRFKKAMGHTLLEYRDKLRLDCAAEMLRSEPDAKVEYICRAVGYTSSGRFAAAFRKRHGLAPGDFKSRQSA